MISTAKRKAHRGSVSKDLEVIGIFLQLIIAIPLIFILLILQGVKAVLKFMREKTERNNRIAEMRKKGFPEKSIALLMEDPGKSKWRMPLVFDQRGRIWFLWEFLLRFAFIFGFVIIVMLLFKSFFDPNFDITNETFLYLVGGLSAYFAFLGSG